MNKFLKITSLFLVIFCFASVAFAQELVGTIEVSTRDESGAAVPGVAITVASTSGTAGYKRTLTTDESGFKRFLQLPPGTYTVSAAATSGFAERTVKNVKVVLGSVTPVKMALVVGTVGVVVDVSAGDNSTIDTSATRIQTNITAETAERLPKGTNFSSLLKVSPATRGESKSGGFQVDGASGSENTFIIDGNEVTNAISGTLDGNNNLPFQLIQEVQVKSSGFAAEYGGATGGVINVVTKGGNNEFSGELGINFRPGSLQAARRDILFLDGGQPTHLRYSNLDSRDAFFPSATFSGPVVKDRVWFLGSYTPQIFETTRTIPYRTGLAPLTYRTKQTNEYTFGRVDAQPFDSLRVSGTYVWNPIAVEGQVPSLSSQFDTSYPNGNGLEGIEYQNSRGGRQNSNITTVQGVYTGIKDLVISGRYGRNFLNAKLGTYGLSSPFPYTTGNSRIACSTSSGPPPPGANCQPGTSNGVAWAPATVFDATVRETIDVDAAYLFSGGGLHELKGGYQYNKIFNNVLAPRNAYLLLYYGSSIDQRSGRNVTPTPGNIGTGRWIRFGAQGKASSTNDAIYVQDKWQPTRRLTLNLGVRFEKEEVPSFNQFSAIEFDWTDKIAPRIGVAYDISGDGKTKVSGFFGWFYDRFKYELPRGSFGGNIFVSDYFELFDDRPFDSYNPDDAITANPPLIQGGSCPQTGTVYGQIRCSVDHRVPSNDPSLDIAEQGGIDPNIKAYRQTEITFTFERQLSNDYLFTSRYTRKKLDRAVEDAGFITPSGSEAYIIGNPGLGLVKEFYEANGWIPTTAKRTYDAVEFRLSRRFADNFYFNANYTWSRLWGNYSGLASSDEEGRTDPNVSRAFDAPFTEATVTGGETTGLLATDRPHVFKFAGAYNLDWDSAFGMGQNNSTEFQTFFSAQSGTPLTTFVNVAGYDSIILKERGDLGRTEFFTQTDFAVRHRYKFGRDSRYTFVGEVDFINLFNQNAVTDLYNNSDKTVYNLTDPANGLITAAEAADPNINATQLAERRFQANGAPGILAAVNSSNNIDVRYKLAENFQAPRTFRFGFRFIF